MAPAKVAHVWQLWKAGIVRDNYACSDEPGIVFELDIAEPYDRTLAG